MTKDTSCLNINCLIVDYDIYVCVWIYLVILILLRQLMLNLNYRFIVLIREPQTN
jgi:hypothetical protein